MGRSNFGASFCLGRVFEGKASGRGGARGDYADACGGEAPERGTPHTHAPHKHKNKQSHSHTHTHTHKATRLQAHSLTIPHPPSHAAHSKLACILARACVGVQPPPWMEEEAAQCQRSIRPLVLGRQHGDSRCSVVRLPCICARAKYIALSPPRIRTYVRSASERPTLRAHTHTDGRLPGQWPLAQTGGHLRRRVSHRCDESDGDGHTPNTSFPIFITYIKPRPVRAGHSHCEFVDYAGRSCRCLWGWLHTSLAPLGADWAGSDESRNGGPDIRDSAMAKSRNSESVPGAPSNQAAARDDRPQLSSIAPAMLGASCMMVGRDVIGAGRRG